MSQTDAVDFISRRAFQPTNILDSGSSKGGNSVCRKWGSERKTRITIMINE